MLQLTHRREKCMYCIVSEIFLQQLSIQTFTLFSMSLDTHKWHVIIQSTPNYQIIKKKLKNPTLGWLPSHCQRSFHYSFILSFHITHSLFQVPFFSIVFLLLFVFCKFFLIFLCSLVFGWKMFSLQDFNMLWSFVF